MVAVVTGASSGTGLVIAEKLIENGLKVIWTTVFINCVTFYGLSNTKVGVIYRWLDLLDAKTSSI